LSYQCENPRILREDICFEKSVSVSQEKLSETVKDVNDKFGDFMQTGGGEISDFFEKITPRVGITAKEFQDLYGYSFCESSS